MKRSPFLLGLILLLILPVTACGTSPQPTNMPVLTNTPLPASRTSPQPTNLITLTNTPAPANTAEPFVLVERDPDIVWHPHEVTFTGPLEMSIPGRNATAGQGWLELTIRPDGKAIWFLRYSIRGANCSNDSGTIRNENYGWTLSAPLPGPAFIVDGMFEFDSWNGLKVVSGQFTSPTEAIAIVEISTGGAPEGTEGYFICDFGTWIWSGEVK